jgi:HD-like signal output (HDOD) protein/CheY-like chemotaxis protein
MVGLMLIAVNERERQILNMAFSQQNIKIAQSDPTYANYIKVLQYIPDVIIMEIPKMGGDQFHFSSMVRQNKKTRKIPIIGYGDKVNEMEMRYITKKGINDYIERPLKFSLLLEIIQKYLKILNKSIDTGTNDTTSEKDEDIKQILDDTTLPSKKIELMVRHVSGLIAFPFTVAKVLHLTGSEKSGANDLAKVIEADPAITASILKVSNTVFFASLNRTISSIKDAVVRIGFKETKRIVMAMSVMDVFGKEDKSFGFNRMDFWVHSLATALIAERIAKRMGTVNTEEAFLAGLLHDFGILLLDEFFPSIFEKILEATTDNGSRFIDNEKKLLGITRNDIIKELFTNWKIPESIIEAIGTHYDIITEQKKFETANEKISLCVYMGNIIAKAYCLGEVCDQYVAPLENRLFEDAKMAAGLGKDFLESINHELDVYRKFLNIKEEKRVVIRESKHIGIYCPVNTLFVPVEEYLQAQGHNATRIPKSDSYTEFDQQFDAIVVWADKKTTCKSLSRLTSIVQRTKKEADTGQEPPLAPVCAIIYKDSTLAQEKPNKISLLYNECDLRKFDEYLQKILENKIIPLPENDEEQKAEGA